MATPMVWVATTTINGFPVINPSGAGMHASGFIAMLWQNAR